METTAAPNRVLDKVLPGPGILLSRAIFYVIFLLLVAAGVWAAAADIDIVVQSRGRLQVEGEPVKITVPEPGMVVEAPVAVGTRVKKGDVLLKLDATKLSSESTQLEAELRAGASEVERHREAAKAGRDVLRKVEEEKVLARDSIKIVESQVDSLKQLLKEGVASIFQVNQKEQEVNEHRARIARLEAEIQRSQTEASLQERQAREIETRLEGVREKLSLMRATEKQMTVLSPVDGTVTQASVLHAGRFLSTGEVAFTIHPDAQPLRALLRLPNASMRRLHPGLPVKIRFDAFPYQDYGHLQGEILRIDPDADEEGHYRAWVRLPSAEIRGPRGAEPLRPGLLLEADVVVERRTVLDLAVKPFKRLGEPIRVNE
ncbi:MAG TPA: HlyD family efflux transporter periplasmic adaptor subunit [Planctomycetota bacterium]|nr:HlyD family efflux transporter periplasmic adaptor subunit [Planctomycetota bacterium]